MMLTLNKLDKKVKKLNRQIKVQKQLASLLKLETTPMLTRLESAKKVVVNEVSFRQDPKNAFRCSLPKRKQRQMGLLPKI